MDKQEIFDTVVTNLRLQGCKSEVGGACMYRGPNNTKCAAGHLIPDKLYDPDMENRNFLGVLIKFPSTAEMFSKKDVKLICDLQWIHDKFEVRDWESNFETIASLHGLVYSPIK